MRAVLFEDPFVSELDPLALARPAYMLSCGGTTLFAGLQQITNLVGSLVRPHLSAVELADRELSQLQHIAEEPTLIVNARLVPSVETFRVIAEIVRRAKPCVVNTERGIAVAVLPAGAKLPEDPTCLEDYYSLRDEIAHHSLPEEEHDLSMLTYAHDIVSEHLLNFADTLEHQIQSESLHQQSDGVFVADPNTVIVMRLLTMVHKIE